MNRKQLDEMLSRDGLELLCIGRSWERGYISRRIKYDDLPFYPSTHRGSSLSRRADWFCVCPSWRTTRYCKRIYFKVVPLCK